MHFATVRDNLARVREEIGRIQAIEGLSNDVRVVGVTKGHPVEAIRTAARAGLEDVGENRVQEFVAKRDQVTHPCRWHLIGHLQRNKVRHAIGKFELIHSVDSLRLAAEIDHRAGAAGLRQEILVQVNLAQEATKFGVAEADLPQMLDGLAEMPNLGIVGLMTIPPPAGRPEDSRRWFARMRELNEAQAARLGVALTELSMGMTDDFEIAVEEGATLVRVGRAIFGERGA